MRRPWNIINLPVYSLLSYSNILNMNICTYVSVVNMNPKIYIISLDYKTQTYQNVMNNDANVILQLLSVKNLSIVKNLGKKTAKNFNKLKYLSSNNLLTKWRNYNVLKNASSFIELKKEDVVHKMSDHALFSFKVKTYTSLNDNILTYNHLINEKIIL